MWDKLEKLLAVSQVLDVLDRQLQMLLLGFLDCLMLDKDIS